MTSKKKNIITCLFITLLIIFIYIPLRTGLLEKQFIKAIILTSEKIVLSISSFEKDKKLHDKDLSKYYSLIKDKFPSIALIAAADKKNKILKAMKNEKYIRSNITFDAMIEGFIRDEFKVYKKNDFVIRYYDQNRFYIFINNITGGKLLIVFPYKLSLKLIIQLILEILLITIFSIIITALISIKLNKKAKTSNGKTAGFIKKESVKKIKPDKTGKDKKISEHKDTGREPDKSTLNLDYLTGYVYDLFNYISGEYNSEVVSFYLLSEDQSRLNKIFELKGKALIKIDDSEFNSMSINRGITEELKNSSTILQEKGKKVTLPVLYRNILLGIITIYRDKEFKGPEINDIALQLKNIAKPLGEHILLADVLENEKA
ncbi:MAG: hypothetical protein JXN64_05835 [Spirochaetes bacterium]|nr:hypothetical protein [Spirochaetota bacterium]